MGFFGGLITFLSVIGIVLAAFVIGAIFGFVALYVAMRKFCPEAWLALDAKVHENNKEKLEQELAEKEEKETEEG